MKRVVPFSNEKGSGAARPAADVALALPSTWEDDSHARLLLLQRLVGQTERDELLRRFFDWINDLALGDGLSFADIDGSAITLGERRHHSARYEIAIEQQKIGTLSLCRRKRYSESDLMVIEQAIGHLAPCLRSAAEVAELKRLVRSDPLTGLGNRPSLDEWLGRELARAARHASPLSVMMIDVDHFKHLNDTLGHMTGDRILRSIATVLGASTRASDLAFRFGGDEFTVLMPHTDRTGAERAAAQIRANLARIPAEALGLNAATEARRPDVSIGIATYRDGDDEVSLLTRADRMLYEAKARGRGRACA